MMSDYNITLLHKATLRTNLSDRSVEETIRILVEQVLDAIQQWDIPKEKVMAALENAAQYDHEIIVESFIEGREFSCGLLRDGDRTHVFPITEIIPKNAFFDYQAKYEGASQEVTPAHLDNDLAKQCQEMSLKIYQILKCRGLVRCDYILNDGIFYLLEVNTIPGLSPASIVPQQAKAYGWSMEHMLDVVIEDCMQKN